MAEALGHTLRDIRKARGKSLAVVAGLAGISPSYLSRLESGERALERRSLIAALADALDVAPNEITGPTPPLLRPQEDDRALTDLRHALLAIDLGEPRGQVQPLPQLTTRVNAVLTGQNNAENAAVGSALPGLLRDLHTTAAAHRDEPAVLRLLTLTHMQGSQAWLTTVGAPVDLCWKAATLARQTARRLDEPVPLGIAAYGTALGLLAAGAFDLATNTLSAVELPMVTTEDIQLAGSLALVSSLVSAARNAPSEQSAALAHAADLAERTGETNMLGFGFGPSNVAVWRMQGALESSEHAQAAAIAETTTPDALRVRARQAVYWREYGRALAHLPKRRESAVTALRRAESLSPEHVQRHPFTRSALAELLTKARRDATGRELRGMAYRAGLHV